MKHKDEILTYMEYNFYLVLKAEATSRLDINQFTVCQ